ncbi:nitronate monooxygenase [Actinoplanes sp. NBRC 101535]|uniref:nitronate monooxygenase n=1 Tax=Actinoplanes sp. NBRC 101535 TaxID=3032196 RepID=UPI0024A54060|nr:nitronate monooxygenase [Actinoplanes sp. NBRC 101535]GLY08587.1 2-nitropropane dioxygenase [Actinoplanes sp. NBRC 101535]
MANPVIIQGGMGVGVSGWRLAQAVARTGQLGVVSGVALDAVLARRLQDGDPDGRMRHALAHFPDPAMAQRVLDRFYVPGGIPAGKPYRPIALMGLRPRRPGLELTVLGNFAEVVLAKEGHDGPVGVNYLEKIQLATPPAVYGAMLAGADYVLMGAGLPTDIPRLLDDLAEHRPVALPVTVHGATEPHAVRFDPADLLGVALPPVPRPRFLAIVSSATLALYLARDSATRPDGFVVESPIAGGHSARPRGTMVLNADGDPVYGPRDRIDLPKMAALGLPFWVAGGQCSPAHVAASRAAGAAGVQVGTAFALCEESGLDPAWRQRLLDDAAQGTLVVRNQPGVSPTGFPFKVVNLPGTTAEEALHAGRPRQCDLGYLRTPYTQADGRVGFRCPAEPADEYVRKGGTLEDTVDSRCLCNGLMATIGLGQLRGTYREEPLITLGQDLSFLPHLGATGTYTAQDVINFLLAAAGLAHSATKDITE